MSLASGLKSDFVFLGHRTLSFVFCLELTRKAIARCYLKPSNLFTQIYGHNLIKWLKEQNEKVDVNISRVEFDKMNLWVNDIQTGSIRHKTGKFFSIDGINVKTNWGTINEWDQPIINQPEIGYLGIIVKEFDGILHFLMQAKIEPGNVNNVQLSPTLQATRSNYQQIHKGKKPLYLEYFQNATVDQVLLDQLQSEQGGRFLRKRNRNIIIKIDDEIELKDNFTWLTLGQLKQLMQMDNLVNMDTRTVISGISYGTFSENVTDLIGFLRGKSDDVSGSAFLKSALSSTHPVNSLDSIISFITKIKSQFDLDIKHKPLNDLEEWDFGDSEIKRADEKYFKIIAVDVEISSREVHRWSQPMVKPSQDGLCAFVCKEINGLLHFAVQAKLECGNFDIIEMAPTVQCLTGKYDIAVSKRMPFVDYVLNASPENVVFDTIQSEEGGRFFREQNRSMIVIADESISEDLPPNYIWLSLNQLLTFLKFNNYLNIQARTLISAISFHN
jgi:dTDP-4-dehydro-6-deoxy-alpha-D-glucopyranose 2,3-dehydratase